MLHSAIILDEDVECGRMAGDVLSDSYFVRVTNNPDVAFGLMSKNDFDVLIVEWSSGTKALIELAVRVQRDLLVVVTSRSRPMVGQIVECFRVGADDFIRTPYHPSELRARVDRLTRAPKGSGRHTLPTVGVPPVLQPVPDWDTTLVASAR